MLFCCRTLPIFYFILSDKIKRLARDREQYNAEMLEQNLMFGSPEEVIAKLKRYEALGVDDFIYYASLGLGQKEQKRSLELFCKEVMPAFS